MGRMSWLGANLDLFDWGRLREVPEPELGHLGTGDIDMEGLGEGLVAAAAAVRGRMWILSRCFRNT